MDRRYFTLPLSSDQAESAANGYFCIEKSIDNYSVWQSLLDGDEVFLAPITVPFKVYHATVRGRGLVDDADAVEKGAGLVIYIQKLSVGEKLRTELYNLRLFSKPKEINKQDATGISALCNRAIKIKSGSHSRELFPLKLPLDHSLRLATTEADRLFLKKCASAHPFGLPEHGVFIVLEKGGVKVGGAVYEVGSRGAPNRLESRVFGDALSYLRDESIYISRTFSVAEGPSKHWAYLFLYLGIFQIAYNSFSKPPSYVCGNSYELLPAAYKAGARIELPNKSSESIFYWKSLNPKSKPLTQDEYFAIRQKFKAIKKRRRLSSAWLCVGGTRDIESAISERLWLLSNVPKQRAKWQSVRRDDVVYLVNRASQLEAIGKVSRTAKHNRAGYEKYPLGIEFAKIHKVPVEYSAAVRDIISWLTLSFSGGIDTLNSEAATALVAFFKSRTGSRKMRVMPNPLLLGGVEFERKARHVFVVQSWSFRGTVLPVLRAICEGKGYTALRRFKWVV